MQCGGDFVPRYTYFATIKDAIRGMFSCTLVSYVNFKYGLINKNTQFVCCTVTSGRVGVGIGVVVRVSMILFYKVFLRDVVDLKSWEPRRPYELYSILCS